VVIKLLLTAVATVILLLYIPSFEAPSDMSAPINHLAHGGYSSHVLHASWALVALLVTTVLSVYKPVGVTPYGYRKQREASARKAAGGPSQAP